MDGLVENEFLKKTPSPKFGLESRLETSDLEFVKIRITTHVYQRPSLLEDTFN